MAESWSQEIGSTEITQAHLSMRWETLDKRCMHIKLRARWNEITHVLTAHGHTDRQTDVSWQTEIPTGRQTDRIHVWLMH